MSSVRHLHRGIPVTSPGVLGRSWSCGPRLVIEFRYTATTLMREHPAVALRPFSRGLVACGAALALHCGGSPSGPSSADATITITSSGVSPSEVRIKTWGHVRFVNQDTRPHAISSDPVQTHADCPGINDVGFLNPGESRETGALNVPRT